MPDQSKPRNEVARIEAEKLAAKADAAPEETPLDAVIIVKSTDDRGNIGTEVISQGEILATEVQTLIELGLASWRAKIGLA
jgi:hypothetical protein